MAVVVCVRWLVCRLGFNRAIAALWLLLLAIAVQGNSNGNDLDGVQAWAYHPNEVQVDTSGTYVLAGVRLTLQLSREVFTNTTASDDRLRIIPAATACGQLGSQKSTISLIRLPVPGQPLEIINTSDIEILDIPGVPSDPIGYTTNITLSWYNLAILEPGMFRICYCSGLLRCNGEGDFTKEVGKTTVMGPNDHQSFTCSVGWPCHISSVSGHVRSGNRLRVMRSCYAPMQTTGFLPGTGLVLQPNETELVVNDPAVSHGINSTRNFSWGAAEILGPGDVYELCWCASHYEGCKRTEHFLVRVGELRLPGPSRQVEILCAAGRLCHFAFSRTLGVDMFDGDYVMVLPGCRSGPNVTSSGWPNDGISEAASHSGRDFIWDALWVNRTAPATGTSRVCWCSSRLRSCQDSDDFRFDAGTVTIAGPKGEQSWLCTLGQRCTISGIEGTTLAVDDYYLPARQCGVPGNLSGFHSGGVVQNSVQPVPSSNSTSVAYSWAKVTALLGNYRLCWAPAWQRPSQRGCSNLGWSTIPEGSALTCARTLLNGACAPVTVNVAKGICSSYGARLCLPHEIIQGETRGDSVCGGDRSLSTWTAQSCGPGRHVLASTGRTADSNKCQQSTVQVTTWQVSDTTASWACCADMETIPTTTHAAWFADRIHYETDAGNVTIRGPYIQDAYCALGDVCEVRVSGVLLNAGTDRLQVVFNNQSCGTTAAAALSQHFGTGRANTTSSSTTVEVYSLGVSKTFGIFRMCWCGVGQTACLQNIDFTVDIGSLLVGGIYGQSFKCIYAVNCTVTMNGTNLGVADSILLLPSSFTCGQATAANVQAANVQMNPATTTDTTNTSFKTFHLGRILRHGDARICYCINFGTRICVDGSGPIYSRFTLSGGIVDVYGPSFNSTLPDSRTGVPYSIVLQGEELSIANRISLQKTDGGPQCGAFGSNISDATVSVATRAPTSVNVPGTQQSWYGAVMAQAGAFRLCWCVGQLPCDRASRFSLQAAWLYVAGIEKNFTYPAQIAGNPFDLTLYGKSLRATDRIVVVPTSVISTCGGIGTIAAMSSQIQGAGGAPTAIDINGVLGAQEFWRNVVVLSVGTFIVCWCGDTSCTLDVQFSTEAARLSVTGPDLSSFSQIVAGEPFHIRLQGSSLSSADRISIVDSAVTCGTSQADILASTVNGTRLSAQAIGAPGYVASNGTSQIWSGLMIRWQGTYKLCWAGNHSFSRRCLTVSNQGNCTAYESAHHPFYVGNLEVTYGNATVVGETQIARCDTLDLMAFSPEPALINGSALDNLHAIWNCTPRGELCRTLEPYLENQTGQLHVFISANRIADMLDRAKWVANGLGLSVPVQSFSLAVTMIDMHNVTRWGSLAISISNLVPLVLASPTQANITLESELHLQTFVNIPGGITCNSPTTNPVTTITWRVVLPSGQFSSLNLMSLSTSGSMYDLLLLSTHVSALGVGTHNISALVNFGNTYPAQEVYSLVHVFPAPAPRVILLAPSPPIYGCPAVFKASSADNSIYATPSLAYNWSCASCNNSLAVNSGPWQAIQVGSLTVGSHELTVNVTSVSTAWSVIKASFTVANTSSVTVANTSNTSSGNVTWSFLPTPLPNAIRQSGGAACEVIVGVGVAKCSPPVNATWSLRRVFGNGSSLGMAEVNLSTQQKHFSIGTQAALGLTAYFSASALVTGGHYRCVLRAGGNLVHVTNTLLVSFPPREGRLIIAPTTGLALQTRFTLTSVDWKTNHMPLLHSFLAVPGHNTSLNTTVSVDPARYLRGFDSDASFGCVLGLSGPIQVAVKVRDSLGAVAFSSTSIVVNAPLQPINYTVSAVTQWPPNARAVSAAAHALVVAASLGNPGVFDSFSTPAGVNSTSNYSTIVNAPAVTPLLSGLWTATRSSSLNSLRQDDLALRAWALERTVLLAGPTLPQFSECLTSSKILERSAAQAATLTTMGVRDTILSETASRLSFAAAIVSSAMASFTSTQSGGTLQETDQVMSLLHGFERQLGQALLLRMRRNWNALDGNASTWDRAVGGNMSIVVGRLPRASVLSGIGVPQYGLHFQVGSVVSRRLSSFAEGAVTRRLNASSASVTYHVAGQALNASCSPDATEVQVSWWNKVAPLRSTPFTSQVKFEGALSDLLATWSVGGGPRDPHVATVRLWMCPENLQHVPGITVKFNVSKGPAGLVETLENGTMLQTYHVNISWVCAQWDTTLTKWRAQSNMISADHASSIDCVSRLAAAPGTVYLAALPGARRTLHSERPINNQVNDDDGLKFKASNLWPLIIAAVVLELPLIILCILDGWDPPEVPRKDVSIASASASGLLLGAETPGAMCVLTPSASLFEGLWQIRSCKVCTWPCSRRRGRSKQKLELQVTDFPEFLPSPQDEASQFETRPRLRQDVQQAGRGALDQVREMQNMKALLSGSLGRRSMCCGCCRRNNDVARQRKLLISSLSAYRTLMRGSARQRQTIRRSLVSDDGGPPQLDPGKTKAALAASSVDVCGEAGVDLADEPFVLRVAHHVQEWLAEISADSDGITLGAEEEISLKTCQLSLQHTFSANVRKRDPLPLVGGLQPQPFFAPPCAARFVLTSVERRDPPKKFPAPTSTRAGIQSKGLGAKVLPDAVVLASSAVQPTRPGNNHGNNREMEPSLVNVMPEPSKAWQDAEDQPSLDDDASPDSQKYLVGCHYYLWVNGKMLFVHRAETLTLNPRKPPQPLDQSLATYENTWAYHLERDVTEIASCPGDDRFIVLNLRGGKSFRWKIDGEIRAWVEGLCAEAPKLTLHEAAPEINDIMHCWQPHMLNDRSSYFFYSLQAAPHMASNVYFETVTARAALGLMWFSHGGATVSFAMIPESLEVQDADGSTALPVALHGPPQTKMHVLGAYLADITSFQHITRKAGDAYSKFCLELLLKDGVKLRLCFGDRFLRLCCEFNLRRLRALVDPGSPGIPTVSQQAPLPRLGTHGSSVTHGADAQDRPVTGSSEGSTGAKYAWLSSPVDSPDTRPMAHSPYPDWHGLSGTLELKVFSATSIGLTEHEDNGGPDGVAGIFGARKKHVVAAGKQPMPCPKVCAYLPTQAPPQKVECRKTPDLPERTANPIWNNTWKFTVEYCEDDFPPTDIRLEVWNVDGRNEFLGEVIVPFPLENSLKQFHLDLLPNTAKMQDNLKIVNGTLSFQICMKLDDLQPSRPGTAVSADSYQIPKFVPVPPQDFRCVCGTLGVEIVRAIGLRSADLLSSDPYCTVLVPTAPRQMSSWKTGTRFGTLNPVWREIHEFCVNWPLRELDPSVEVKMELWDHDAVSSDEFLGEISFPLPNGDGENLIDMEVQPNHKKGSNSVKGRVQARVYFRSQFELDHSVDIDAYEAEFCDYFGAHHVDDQLARAIAPPLIFFHFASCRLLVGQLREAWRRATCNLVASKAARGAKTRAACYLELVSSVSFGVGAAGLLLHFWPKPVGAAVGGWAAAFLQISPARLMTALMWHRPALPPSLGRMGLGVADSGPAIGFSALVFFLSLIGIGTFVAIEPDQDAVKYLAIAAGVLLISWLVLFPLFHGLRLTLLVLHARVSKTHDRQLRLFPSLMTANGALLESLPAQLLAPPA